MTTKYFKCEFLSDVVLNADTATEGNQETLDYIPGSNFLGIVAKSYQDFASKGLAFDIFHSGKVRFGDAHFCLNDKRSLKCPAAWFTKKDDTEKKEIFVHYAIPKDKREKLIAEGDQLKQVRSGYFIPEKNSYSRLDFGKEMSFSIKSAYDSETRKSQDAQLYGYTAIRKGCVWLFGVEADDKSMLEMVEVKLIGEHNIGRSRSAQYGRVKIDSMKPGSYAPSASAAGKENEVILYFESRAVFFDSSGQATLEPAIYDLKLPEGYEILWAKSQILSFVYAPWNAKRKTRDADRVCIDKGSVIVAKVPTDFLQDKYLTEIERGIGIHRNEGFGKILVNPIFLVNTDDKGVLSLVKTEMDKKNDIPPKIEAFSDLTKWIDGKLGEKDTKIKILKKVKAEVNAFPKRGISPSQWGAIRAIAESAKDYGSMINYLFREPVVEPNRQEQNRITDGGGFLRHGKKMKDWNEGDKWKELKRIIDAVVKEFGKEAISKEAKTLAEDAAVKFLILFCSEMAKHGNKE